MNVEPEGVGVHVEIFIPIPKEETAEGKLFKLSGVFDTILAELLGGGVFPPRPVVVIDQSMALFVIEESQRCIIPPMKKFDVKVVCLRTHVVAHNVALVGESVSIAVPPHSVMFEAVKIFEPTVVSKV